MNLRRVCLSNEFPDIVQRNAGSGQYFDPAVSMLDQLADQVSSLRSGVLLTAGENASDAQLDQLVQRAKGIGRDIEGAVKYRLTRADARTKRLRSANVDRAIRIEDSENNAVGAMLQEQVAVALHHGEFRRRVTESGLPWTIHRDDWDAGSLLNFQQRTKAWRQATKKQGRA